MNELFSKLKKMSLEPRVYALMVKSTRGQTLHLGVYFSLEEAYSYARQHLQSLIQHKPNEAIDIESWNSMSAKDCIALFFDPERPIPANAPADPPNPTAFTSPTENDLLKTIMDLTKNTFAEEQEKKIRHIPTERTTQALLDMLDNDEDVGVEEYVEDVKDAKNDLLYKLIDIGDVVAVKKHSKILTSYEKRFVLKKIADKAAKLKESKG